MKIHLAFTGFALVLGATALAAPAPFNLLAEREVWQVATPFKPAGMEFDIHRATNDTTQLAITSHGHARDIGGWVRSLPPLAAGRRYRFTATFVADGIPAPQRHVWALITTEGREFLEFVSVGKSGNRHRLALEFTPEKGHPHPELRLYLADTASGTVTWEAAGMEDITDHYQPRKVHIGVISGTPSKPKRTQDAVDFYLQKLEAVAGLGLDLVCLPENMNVDGVAGDRWDMLEPIPGPTTRRLGEVARRNSLYIAASLAERDGKTRYNSAVLIDRRGELVAKYRKSHLTIGEHLLNGITEGDDLIVYHADFGKIGFMICWDNHFPEVARILALKGADIIVLPNAGDGREHGTLWESSMRIRAVDNNVFIASAVNSGRSMIVGPDGEILEKNGWASEQPGGLVHAACEIGDSVANYTGQPINKRYLQTRRPEIYQTLLHDLDGDVKATVNTSPDQKLAP